MASNNPVRVNEVDKTDKAQNALLAELEKEKERLEKVEEEKSSLSSSPPGDMDKFDISYENISDTEESDKENLHIITDDEEEYFGHQARLAAQYDYEEAMEFYRPANSMFGNFIPRRDSDK